MEHHGWVGDGWVAGRITAWLQRQATGGTGVAARIGARRLCRRLLRAGRYDWEAATRVLLVLYQARDPRAADLAAAALDRAWADDTRREPVWSAICRLAVGWEPGLSGPYEIVALPPRIVRFLLAPGPGGGTRLEGVLSRDPERDAHAAGIVVSAAVGAADDPVRRDLSQLLSTSAHPALLGAVERAVEEVLLAAGGRGRSLPPGYRLWDAGEPAPLLRLALTNPHLPRPPVDPRDGRARGALVAILFDRLDLLERHVGFYLLRVLKAALAGPLPAEVAATIRRALREVAALEDAVCYEAVSVGRTNHEVAAAFREAGAGWRDPRRRALYLYFTRQWREYDRHDPNGELIWAYLLDHHWNVDIDRMRRMAARAGRRDPLPAPAPGRAGRVGRERPAGIRGSDYGGIGHFGIGSGGFGGSF
jgi:hypothetical protein